MRLWTTRSSGTGNTIPDVHTTTVTLERLEAEAQPPCDFTYCNTTADWIARTRCNCADDTIALVCTRHARWVRITDLLCIACEQPARLIALGRI